MAMTVNDLIVDCLMRARDKYGFHGDVKVDLTLRGRCAGRAGFTGRKDQYILKLNMQAPPDSWHGTIAHEVAHIVDHFTGGQGAGASGRRDLHGCRWRSICLGLGGDGDTCHDMPLTKARRTRYFEYRLPSGDVTWLGGRKHKYIQRRGHGYRIIKTGEAIHAHHWTGGQKLE